MTKNNCIKTLSKEVIPVALEIYEFEYRHDKSFI